jgi:hypothetical protein
MSSVKCPPYRLKRRASYALFPTLARPPEGIEDGTEESAARKSILRQHRNGMAAGKIMASSDGIHGRISAVLIFEATSFETLKPHDVDCALPA